MRLDIASILKPFSSRFVYMIGDDGAILVYMEKDKVVRRLFAASPAPEHTQGFLELLKAYPKAPIYALIDTMDQAYVRHKLPPVSSLGLNKLVARRLERDFAKDDIKGALNLGRESGGRKDWNLLLISLATTDVLKAWMGLVLELPNYFGGIYLLPVECEYVVTELAEGYRKQQVAHAPTSDILPDIVISEMEVAPLPVSLPDAVGVSEQVSEGVVGSVSPSAASLSPKKMRLGRWSSASRKQSTSQVQEKSKKSFSFSFGGQKKSGGAGGKKEAYIIGSDYAPMWQVFISHHKVGGFRQVVLRDGKLIFTRQAQSMDDAPAEMIAGSVEQELQNTIEYLRRLAFEPHEGLEVFILISEEIKSHISNKNFAGIGFYVLTPYEAAQYLQLSHAVLSSDRFGDIIVATVFGSHGRKRLKLNLPYAQKLDVFYKARKAVRVLGALSVVGLVLMCVGGLFSWLEASDKLENMHVQKRTKQQNLDDVKKTSQSLGADVDLVTDLIAMHKEVIAPIESPLTLSEKLYPLISDEQYFGQVEWEAANVMFGDTSTDAALPVTSPSPTPAAGATDQKPTPIYTIKLVVDLVYHAKDWKEFVAKSEESFKKYQEIFPDYLVTHTNIPGLFNPNDAIEIRDSDKKEGPKLGDVFSVTFNINGPKAKDAAASVASPPPAAE